MNRAPTNDANIRDALATRRIAVVGLSPKPSRDSHGVARYLIEHGYDVVPVNPREDTILGRTCYPDLAAVPGHIDVVDVFRDPSAVPDIAAESVRIGADFLWLQYDVISDAGVAIAEAGGVRCIVDRCIKVEHARLR